MTLQTPSFKLRASSAAPLLLCRLPSTLRGCRPQSILRGCSLLSILQGCSRSALRGCRHLYHLRGCQSLPSPLQECANYEPQPLSGLASPPPPTASYDHQSCPGSYAPASPAPLPPTAKPCNILRPSFPFNFMLSTSSIALAKKRPSTLCLRAPIVLFGIVPYPMNLAV